MLKDFLEKINYRADLLEKISPEAKKLFTIFDDKIRLVGGAVRDLLLKKNVADFDFATVFLPQKTVEILQSNNIKAVPTGLKYGTVTAVINHKNFEITTLRSDKNQQGRDCEVEFIDDYFLDASRRDFTINALYLDHQGLVYDFFDGISDLQQQKLRFIGDPDQRISEDYLRILRFFRFSCDYAQKLDKEGLISCLNHKSFLKNLSRERIRAEFFKLISSTKHKQLIEILQIIVEQKITQEIWLTNLDYQALERLLNFAKKLQINFKNDLKLAVIFGSEELNMKIFVKELCVTNSEKKFLEKLIKITKNFLPSNLNEKELKKLLVFEKQELVIDWLFYVAAKNKIAINQDEIFDLCGFIKNFVVPNFEIKPSDLINLGIEKEKISQFIFKAKIHWIDSNFTASKQEIIEACIQNNFIN